LSYGFIKAVKAQLIWKNEEMAWQVDLWILIFWLLERDS